MYKYLITLLTLSLLSGCVTVPPKNINNACSIAQQYPNWYYSSLDSYKKWGVPISVQWAIIRKESSFIADAKTPKTYFLFIPTGRVSTAYGYSQALDGTWLHYQKSTGNHWASRTDFDDAVDFIGWYGDMSHRLAGISKKNAKQLYLAYHDGVGKYNNPKYKASTFIQNYASSVQSTAYNYAKQLRQCRIKSKNWWW